MKKILYPALEILITFAMGYLMKKLGYFTQDDAVRVIKLVVNALVPMALAVNLCRVEFKMTWLILIACPLVYAISTMPIFRAIFKRCPPGLSRTDRGQLLLCCTGHAVTLVGYPVSAGFYGKDGLAMMAAYDLGNFIVAYIFTFTVATLYKPPRKSRAHSDADDDDNSDLASHMSVKSVLSSAAPNESLRNTFSHPGIMPVKDGPRARSIVPRAGPSAGTEGNVVDIDGIGKPHSGRIAIQENRECLDEIVVDIDEDDGIEHEYPTVFVSETTPFPSDNCGPRPRGFTDDEAMRTADSIASKTRATSDGTPQSKPRTVSDDTPKSKTRAVSDDTTKQKHQIRHMYTIGEKKNDDSTAEEKPSSDHRKTLACAKAELRHGRRLSENSVVVDISSALLAMVKRILLLPPTIGFLIGVGMRAIEKTTDDLPEYIDNVMVNTSKCTAILTIFGLGMFFQPSLLMQKKYTGRLCVLFAFKYGFALLVGLTTWAIIRKDEPLLPVIMTISLVMPTPPAVIAYAGEFGYDQVFAALVVNAGLILSFILAFVVALIFSP